MATTISKNVNNCKMLRSQLESLFPEGGKYLVFNLGSSIKLFLLVITPIFKARSNIPFVK